jgi:hypothetical protein
MNCHWNWPISQRELIGPVEIPIKEFYGRAERLIAAVAELVTNSRHFFPFCYRTGIFLKALSPPMEGFLLPQGFVNCPGPRSTSLSPLRISSDPNACVLIAV